MPPAPRLVGGAPNQGWGETRVGTPTKLGPAPSVATRFCAKLGQARSLAQRREVRVPHPDRRGAGGLPARGLGKMAS